MKVGDTVYHASYGSGVLLEVDKFAVPINVVVKYPWGDIRKPASEFQIPDSVPPGRSVAEAIAVRQEAMDEEPSIGNSSRFPADPIARARLSLIALRLGQVLEDDVERLSVGVDTVRESFHETLRSVQGGHGAAILIEGPWGGGKTHALTLLRSMAHSAGLASTHITLDGISASLTKPQSMLDALLRGLRHPSDPFRNGLRTWLRRSVRDGGVSNLARNGAPLLAAVLRELPPMALVEESVWDVLEGHLGCVLSPQQTKSQLKAILGRGFVLPAVGVRPLSERPRRFAQILSEVAMAVRIGGGQGLLVVFDELDVEYSVRDRCPYPVATGFRRQTLDALSDVTSSQVPLVVAFSSAPVAAMATGSEDPADDVSAAFVRGITRIRVPDPTEEDLSLLLGRIQQIYADAYPQVIPNTPTWRRNVVARTLETYRRIPSRVPRHLVRMGLEILDLASLYPNLHLDGIGLRE